MLDELIAFVAEVVIQTIIDAVIGLAGWTLELLLMLLAAVMTLFVMTGRGMFRLFNSHPHRAVLFVTGTLVWGAIGGIAYAAAHALS
jgi:hypothetical protein